MITLKTFWAAGAAALLAASCGPRDPGEPEELPETPPDENAALDADVETAAVSDAELEKRAADNLAASQSFLKENAAREGVVVTDSGLQYMVVAEGSADGATPVSTDIIVFDYVASKSDGVEIDSSQARGAAATLPVGALNASLPGLVEGIQLMREGASYRFFLPPDLALGQGGSPNGVIGPNETLIYEVDLHKVQNPERNLVASTNFLDENSKKDGVMVTDSGLQYTVLEEGDDGGASPDASDKVSVHYNGTLINGTVFDSSYARGAPIEFGLGGVIAGWTEGLQLMSVGDKYRFFIPPELAYGESGKGPIGPNEALIFDVELLDVVE